MTTNCADTIDRFAEDYEFLSNFAPSPIEFEGIRYPTVEHAYQAQKSLDPDFRQSVAELATPGRAKRAGQRVALRADWDDVRIPIMTELLRLKFADPELGQRLLGTGAAELIEGNSWGDRFWGVCQGEGENRLGRILMQLRDELRSQSGTARRG